MADVPADRSMPAVQSLGGARLILRALRHRNYRLFFGGQIISLVGTFLTQTATVWLVERLTHKPWLLGLVGFMAQIPMFAIAPFAGVWIDRVRRRRSIIVTTQVLAMLQSFALAILAYEWGQNAAIAVPGIIVLSLIQGVINAFDMPARQAFVVEMVEDRADLSNAIALNSTMVHAARLIGPALAGLLIWWVGESLCFLIDGISYIAVIAALLAMVVQPRPIRVGKNVLAELREGFRYVWDFVPIRVLLVLMGVLSLTGMPAFGVLMPIFGDHYGGARVFGFLGAASGAGALAGALYLASRRSVVGLGGLIVWSTASFGLALIAFASVNSLPLAMLIVPVGAWGIITNFASANTMIQTLVDDDMRGRVMSFYSMAFMGMTPFGSLLAGQLATHLAAGDPVAGARRTLVIVGIISVVAALGYARKLPGMRAIIRPIYVKKGILAGD